MTRKIGGVSYEGRFFIVHVPDDWQSNDPLPAPTPDDLWFETRVDFEEALGGPWHRKPVNRRPWNAAASSVRPLQESRSSNRRYETLRAINPETKPDDHA